MADEQELYERFSAEFLALQDHPGVVLEMTAIQAWAVLSSIQLACRHPEFTGPTRQMAEEIARQIQEGLAKTPALAEVAARGWELEG
jgi:hypothetical protein